MATQRFTGNLAASTQPNVPSGTDNTRNWGEGVDPRHDSATYAPDAGFPPPEPHIKLRVPEWVEDEMVFIHREPPYFPDADTETSPYDDKQQHNPETLPYGVPDNDRLRQMSGRLHSQQKRIFPYQMSIKVDRDFTTKNETLREQSLPQSNQGSGPLSNYALRALRGRNSLAVNNPGDPDVSFSGNYVRQGWNISRWTNRRMPRKGLSHTKRELHLNLASTAKNTPGKPGPYASMYPTFARLNVGTYKPSVRREPGQWDIEAADDYSDTTGEETMPSWGL